VLSAQLPADVVEELADGLDLTCQRYVRQGLDPDSATGAALAEFGEPDVVVAAFTRLSPARRAARRLLAAGPVVGACWAGALITGRAWTWPVPLAVRVLLGLVLIAVVGLLAAAAFGRQYRPVSRAAAAGCAGIATLDAAMLIAVIIAAPAVIWPLLLPLAASAGRLTFATRALHPILAS
jgi:hypothetical protein